MDWVSEWLASTPRILPKVISHMLEPWLEIAPVSASKLWRAWDRNFIAGLSSAPDGTQSSDCSAHQKQSVSSLSPLQQVWGSSLIRMSLHCWQYPLHWGKNLLCSSANSWNCNFPSLFSSTRATKLVMTGWGTDSPHLHSQNSNRHCVSGLSITNQLCTLSIKLGTLVHSPYTCSHHRQMSQWRKRHLYFTSMLLLENENNIQR